MNNIRCILLCSWINIKKWRTNPRIYVLFIIVVIFHYYAFSCVPQICRYLNMEITPWVFPFFMGHPTMFLAYGGLAIFLYCDAPFTDGHTPFLLIRTGAQNWILGQLLYIFISSFFYTLFHVAVSMAMLVPYLTFSGGWGSVLQILSDNGDIFIRAGATQSFLIYSELLEAMSPMQAMGWSILLFWLGCMFLGVVIFCFNLCIARMSGIVVSSILTVFAYFSSYLGFLSFGDVIRFLTPVSWSCLAYLDWLGTGLAPSPSFAAVAYALMIGILSLISIAVFCRKDLVIQRGAV